jgi:transcription antitermination factor NusG
VLKPQENPPIIWPEVDSVCEITGTWWVAHTKSRNEKALAHDLMTREVSYFLPMVWKTRHIRKRKVKALLPLFKGYLFFCGEERERLEVLKTNRVANVIEATDQQQLTEELQQIYRAIRTGADLEPHKHIKKGQRCRVEAGPLRGLQGRVLREPTGARLILNINMLGQAASVEVDIDDIEVID